MNKIEEIIEDIGNELHSEMQFFNKHGVQDNAKVIASIEKVLKDYFLKKADKL